MRDEIKKRGKVEKDEGWGMKEEIKKREKDEG